MFFTLAYTFCFCDDFGIFATGIAFLNYGYTLSLANRYGFFFFYFNTFFDYLFMQLSIFWKSNIFILNRRFNKCCVVLFRDNTYIIIKAAFPEGDAAFISKKDLDQIFHCSHSSTQFCTYNFNRMLTYSFVYRD